MKKRDYAKKGLYYGLILPFAWPYRQFKNSRGKIKSSVTQLRNNLQGLKQNRDPWDEAAPDMSDFKQVLFHWGITENEIERVVRGMKAQLILFACLGFWGAYLLTGSQYVRLNGIPLTFIGLVIVITRLWRVQVLERRLFVFFKDWFLWGLFSWIGRETPFARDLRLKKEDSYE